MFSKNNDRQKLEQAKQLIQQKEYQEAIAILKSMPNNATAKSWLAKLGDMIVDDIQVAFQAQFGPAIAAMERIKQKEAKEELERRTSGDEKRRQNPELTIVGLEETSLRSGISKWEYCKLEADINDPEAPTCSVNFLMPNGRHDVRKDDSFMRERHFWPVVDQIIAQLGIQGWELISTQTGRTANVTIYLFKRPAGQSSQ